MANISVRLSEKIAFHCTGAVSRDIQCADDMNAERLVGRYIDDVPLVG